jgi:hypothetical protein
MGVRGAVGVFLVLQNKILFFYRWDDTIALSCLLYLDIQVLFYMIYIHLYVRLKI